MSCQRPHTESAVDVLNLVHPDESINGWMDACLDGWMVSGWMDGFYILNVLIRLSDKIRM